MEIKLTYWWQYFAHYYDNYFYCNEWREDFYNSDDKERLEKLLGFEEKLKTKEKLKIEKNLETSEKDSKKSFFPYGMSIC